MPSDEKKLPDIERPWGSSCDTPPTYRATNPARPKPEQRLRFEDDARHSIDSGVSDFNKSVYDEPVGVRAKPSTSRWTLGILDAPAMLAVPGTCHLLDDGSKWDQSHGITPTAFSSRLPPFRLPSRSAAATPATPRPAYMKRTNQGKIILAPQPDDTPNDPLNWPAWRREAPLLSLAIFSSFAGAMTAVFAGGLGRAHFAQSHMHLAYTNITYLAGLALGHVLQTPIANIYGKRLVYLYSAWMFIATSVFCAFSGRFAMLLVGRTLMGIALSPMYVLVPATIADLFPLHQRGRALGPYCAVMLSGLAVVPAVSAVLTKHLNWRWTFVLAATCAVFPVFLIIFLVPESYWSRSSRFVHTDACVKARNQANGEQDIICGCLATSKAETALVEQVQRRQSEKEKVAVQRDRVLAKLNVKQTASKTEQSLRGANPTTRSPAGIQSPFQTIELSPAEAEIALSRHAFDDLSGELPSPGRRRSYRPPRLHLGPRIDNETAQRPTYLRFVPANVWYSPARAGIPTSPCPSPNVKANDTEDGPHGRTGLAKVMSVQTDKELPSPPRSDASSERRANRPTLRLQTPSVLFDRENLRSATPHPWTRPRVYDTPSAAPPTSLPTTPAPYATITPRQAQHSPAKPRHPPTVSLYTERLRLLPRQSWTYFLRPFPGRLTSTTFCTALIQPARLLARPTLLYAMLLYATSLGLLSLLPRLVHLLFHPGAAVTLALLPGVVPGGLVAGWAADRLAIALSRRNEGVFEPEFRLLVGAGGLCLSIGGVLGLGFAKGHVGASCACIFVIGMGGAAAILAAVGYVLDCCEEVGAAMTLLGLGSCIYGILTAVFIDHWVASRGGKEVCIVLAGMHGLALLCTLPMYMLGKRARAVFAMKRSVQ